MQTKRLLLALGLLLALFGILAAIVALIPSIREIGNMKGRLSDVLPKAGSPDAGRVGDIGKFGSEEEFRSYLVAARAAQSSGFGMGGRMGGDVMTLDAATPETSVKSTATPERFSETNVQVAGIDEPDIVKTDGSTIYFSREPDYRILDSPVMEKRAADTEASLLAPGESGTVPAYVPTGRTDIISAVPAEAMSKVASLGRSGEMLLFGDTLVVFDLSRRDIAAFDISDKANPKEKWVLRQTDGTELLAARKYGDTLYLVEKTWVNESSPCPITPFSVGAEKLSIACVDIYRPAVPSFVDAVFAAVAVDPKTGAAKAKTSFVGSSGQSTVYMSENAVYATFPEAGDPMGYILGFFRGNRDLLPEGIFERLEKLAGYDIGQDAKMTEFSRIMEQALFSRDADDRLRFQSEVQNRMTDYAKTHLRELGSTGIAKLSLSDLSLAAEGSVPGYLLNQFSLDEYDGRLRVATTVGGRQSFGFGWVNSDASANDVYVLDADLDREGRLLDLGQGERIYAARFIGETGYLVTFKETDPFYVLDLSDPDKPRLAGELKIPGYSSYLHPLGDDLILGVGKEDDKVKLSLFDVSSPDEPREVSKYVLDEYWSEAMQNHHAFLADPAHDIFFIPGYQGGYAFSHEGNELSLAKAAKGDRIKRALFIDDVFYIVSEDAAYAYDIDTWGKKGELGL